MRVAILAPTPVPRAWGGAERAVDGLRQAVEDHTDHTAEVVNVPVYERDLVGTMLGYRDFATLDVSSYDRVISVKYPAWMAAHPDHTVLMFHPLRGLYDTYPPHLPIVPAPSSPKMIDLCRFVTRHRHRAALPEFFDRFFSAAADLEPGHPDLAHPGPVARSLVRWLDQVALSPGEVHRHLALSRTVASRDGYFPPDVQPRVLHLPGHLPPAPQPGPVGSHFFTASRLDGPKRLDLLIRAMEAVEADVPLLIAGRGPEERRLRHLAARDHRIDLLGFVTDDELADLYRNAIAVPFIPFDEDLGLISLEAFSQGAPVVTTTDAGGPTEFVRDGVTGIVAEPYPHAIGWALERLAADRELARDMGAAAAERATRVTWERAARVLLPDPAAAGRRPAATAGPAPSATRRPAPRRPRGKVLVAATFGIEDPRHGGQLRARNLYGALAEHADVHLVALAFRETPGHRALAPGLSQTVVHRSAEQSARDDAAGEAVGFGVTDILSGLHGDLTPELDDALRAAAAGADAVILAEPYLLPAVRRAGIDLPFVYDAYNVELDLKSSALPDTPLGRSLLDQVTEIERSAVRDAAAVVACSPADAEALGRLHGRDGDAFTVIPNGTHVPATVPGAAEREAARRRWVEHLHHDGGDRRIEHLAVFFGSWHPPNLDAAELIIEIAASLPQVQFVAGGSHGHAFDGRTLPPNVAFPGIVTDTVRRTLLDTASVALNPMRLGSGTNLKLVEYLAAGVPTVSTRFGVRGMPVAPGEHLLLADDPDGFAAAVAETVADPDAAQRRAVAGRAVAAAYDWTALGDRLAAVLGDVSASATSL